MDERDILTITNLELAEMSEEEVEIVQKARLEEVQLCMENFDHFAKRWIKITHPKRGLVPFQMYEYQERMVRCYEENRFNIISKFRQGGATTTTVLWCMWRCLFKCDQKILVVSIGDREAIGAGKIVKNALDNLPDWMQPEMSKNNDHEKEFFDTNSVIFFYSPKAARSMSLTYLVVDEAAFILNMEELWAAMMPTLSAGGHCVVISTVNGIGNWYEETYHRAVEKKNEFNVIEIDYREHPDYKDPKFATAMRSNLGEKKWLQEFERSFLGTGETYIAASKLAELDRLTIHDEPIRRIWGEWDSNKEDFRPEYLPNDNYTGGAMWIWKEPEPGREYILAADVSEGVGEGSDYSAFQIIETISCEQCAEFYSNMVPPHMFAHIISQMGTYYNSAQVVIENQSIGVAVVNRLQLDLYYDNLYHDSNDKPGVRTGAHNRPMIIESIQYAITSNTLKIRSRRLCRELKNFVFNKAKRRPEATKNKHDDLILAMCLALYVRDDQVRRVPLGSNEHLKDRKLDTFEVNTFERIKKSIMQNAPSDYISAEDDFFEKNKKDQPLPGLIWGERYKRPHDKLLRNEFGW